MTIIRENSEGEYTDFRDAMFHGEAKEMAVQKTVMISWNKYKMILLLHCIKGIIPFFFGL
ncbi:hypothetical protein [Psychrobacillus sp. OK032]|uniref:hypothetical protein n=1 Tax=Psychrobacillus sp. OK032 TaxID=1884358 RepID=UPI0011609B86|nr:hypothetical protein [Psychrobacillus sp. OK032]